MIVDHPALTIERFSDYIRVTFLQDVNMDVMLRLKPQIESVLPQLDRVIIIDLAAVHFLDSSAVGMIAILFRHAQYWRRPIAFIAANPQPEAVLAMVGLSDYVPLYADLKTALAALKGAA